MAGPLAWRDVAAPDFAPAMQGNQQFMQMLNQAFGQAREGIKSWDDTNTEAVNKNFAAALAGMHGVDPDVADAQIRDLIKGSDLRRLSADNLTAANAKYGQLMGEKSTKLGIEKTETDMAHDAYKWQRDLGFDQADDASRPIIARAAQIAATGKPEDLAASRKLISDNMDVFGRQRTADMLKALDLPTEMASKGLGFDSAVFADHKNRVEFGHSEEDRQVAQVSDAAAMKLATRGDILNPQQAAAAVRDLPKPEGMDPVLWARIQSATLGNLTSKFAPLVNTGIPDAPLDPNSIGGPDGADRVMNYQARAAGFGSIPTSVKNLGDFSDYALKVNAAGVPSSAGGLFQIVGETVRGKDGKPGVAEQVFGKDWRNIDFTPENQDKLAARIFADNKGSAAALLRQWPSLAKVPGGAEAVRNMPWAQARAIIARHESGAILSPSQLDQQTAGVKARMAVNEIPDEDKALAREMLPTWTDNSPPILIAKDLIAKKGFDSDDPRALANDIDQYAKKYHVSPMVAGGIFARSIKSGAPSFFDVTADPRDWYRGFTGRSTIMDQDRLDQLGKKYGNHGDKIVKAAVSIQRNDSNTANIAGAQAMLAKATQRYQALVARARNGLGDPAALAQAQQDWINANQAVQQYNRAADVGARDGR